MRAFNLNKGKSLGTRIDKAQNLRSRMLGLLCHSELSAEQGLWLSPCSSIHTFGMRFPIDVVFLNKSGHVLKAYHQLKPQRLSAWVWQSKGALELPSGTLLHTQTEVGDQIVLEDAS